jgi:hypothetical protein
MDKQLIMMLIIAAIGNMLWLGTALYLRYEKRHRKTSGDCA